MNVVVSFSLSPQGYCCVYDDPGLMWMVRGGNVHQALGMRNAPIPQGMCDRMQYSTLPYHLYNPLGVDPQASEEVFCRYILNLLLVQTPLDEAVNGVQVDKIRGNRQYSTNCLHKLLVDEFDRAKPYWSTHSLN